MAYKVVIADDALEFLGGLPPKIQRQIASKIDKLVIEPRPAKCKKIHGRENTYRIRSGDYCIVYEIHDDKILVLVIRIRHRKDAYKGLVN